jgi:hypothetical protein
MPKPFFINSLYAICILIVGCGNDNPRQTKEFNHLQIAVRIPDLSIPGSFIRLHQIG